MHSIHFNRRKGTNLRGVLCSTFAFLCVRPVASVVLALGLAPAAAAAEAGSASPVYEQKIVPFVRAYCLDCHSGTNPKASFSFEALQPDFSQPRFAQHWEEVMNQINLGEMPPEDRRQPTPAEVLAVAEWIGGEIRRAAQESRMRGGQVVLRRLNRDEYANTIIDLLALDPGLTDTIRGLLPADGTADGFDRIAAALYLDQTQVESYLDAGKFIAELAIREKPIATSKVVWQPGLLLDDKHVQADISKDIVLKAGVRWGEVRKDNLDAIFSGGSGVVYWNAGDGGPGRQDNDPEKFYGSQGWWNGPDLTKTVTADGYYRIRFPAGASRGERGAPIKMQFIYGHQSSIFTQHIKEVQGTIDQPVMNETMMFLKKPNPDQKVHISWNWNAPNIIMTNPAHSAVMGGYGTAAANIAKGKQDGADEATMAKLEQEREAAFQALKNFDQPVYQIVPGKSIEKAPKLLLGPFEVEGPIQEWPPKSHLTLGIKEGDTPNEQSIRRVFSQLIPRAFRRPVEPAEIEFFVTKILNSQRTFGLSHIETLRYGLQGLLVAPGFLMIQEPQPKNVARPLDNFELANRLSYFLWNSMPDAELLQVAASGRLTDPSTRRQQVDRMLKDPKIGRFVESFAGQWLDVRRYGTVVPAFKYQARPGSPYDRDLEFASKQEPLAFFRHVLDHNLPITDFVQSDYLVINNRLAQHYQIPNVAGPEFRKVSIPAGVERGGVLGMVGLLTLLSDGSRTLPVRRAAWVREKLLNDPPSPPPPGAGEIQPNTAGANLTVRQRLELHRKEPTCASCHAALDGYGLALENYDAIGAWSTPPLDTSGTLKSGRVFRDLKEFKQALLMERDSFGRAFVHTMLTYALTRPVGVMDRETLDEIDQQLQTGDFRIHSVIHGITQSRLFLTK